MKFTKKLIASLAVLVMSIMVVPAAYAQTTTDDNADRDRILVPVNGNQNSSLRDALILNSATSKSSLGDLFVLDRLFSNNSGILSNGNTSLGNLFILDQLFDGGGILGSGGVLGGSALGGSSSIGDLFVLDQLFGSNGNLLGGGNGTDLGDLFILDQLFR